MIVRLYKHWRLKELLKRLQLRVNYGNIIGCQMLNLTDRRKNVFTEATVAKTTEAAASVASNVATALNYVYCVSYL